MAQKRKNAPVIPRNHAECRGICQGNTYRLEAIASSASSRSMSTTAAVRPTA